MTGKLMRALLLGLFSLASFAVKSQDYVFKPIYVNHTETGVLFGRVGPLDNNVGVANKVNFTAQTFNGILVRPRLATGITLGVDWYNAVLINPVAAGIRYDIKRRQNTSFFATGDIGYGFTWFQKDNPRYETRGGWMLNPGFGFRMGSMGSTGFTMVFFYKMQKAKVDKPITGNMIERYEERTYNRVGVRLGISF